MPDSPKCIHCLKKGLVGQTIKVAGKPAFKCMDCKQVYRRDSFEPIEFTWKEDFDSYKQWLTSKGIDIKCQYSGNKDVA